MFTLKYSGKETGKEFHLCIVDVNADRLLRVAWNVLNVTECAHTILRLAFRNASYDQKKISEDIKYCK